MSSGTKLVSSETKLVKCEDRRQWYSYLMRLRHLCPRVRVVHPDYSCQLPLLLQHVLGHDLLRQLRAQATHFRAGGNGEPMVTMLTATCAGSFIGDSPAPRQHLWMSCECIYVFCQLRLACPTVVRALRRHRCEAMDFISCGSPVLPHKQKITGRTS